MPTYELSVVLRQMARVSGQKTFVGNGKPHLMHLSAVVYSPMSSPRSSAPPRRSSTTAASFASWRTSARGRCRTRSANTVKSIGRAAIS